MYNIILLDIDGVLNTRNHLRRQYKEAGKTDNGDWCPRACKYVSLICDQFDARIVISSTWRYEYSLPELRNIFRDNEISPDHVIDTTPALIYEEETTNFCRGDEIARWLNENDHCRYVIIDDAPESEFLEHQQSQLVTVDADVGFADKERVKAVGEVFI